MSEMNLSDRAAQLRAEQMTVQQRLQHAEDYDEVLSLVTRERDIPLELRAVAFATRARQLRENREESERISDQRKARNTKLRERIAEIRTQLETEKDGAERDRLGRERDRLIDDLRNT
jgi:hypothetical protein